MRKNDIIKAISQDIGCTKLIAGLVLDSAINIIKREVSEGNTITLRGFVTVKPVLRKPKIGRSPTENKVVKIPAQYVPVFKPYDEFRILVKNKLKPL